MQGRKYRRVLQPVIQDLVEAELTFFHDSYIFSRPGKAHIKQVLSKLIVLVAHQNSEQRQVLQHKNLLLRTVQGSFIDTKIDHASFWQ